MFVEQSFNPCYAGSKIESNNMKLFSITTICFNPCYAGSKIERRQETFRRKFVFKRFNPCYVGSKMERKQVNQHDTKSKKFQSLLCWK